MRGLALADLHVRIPELGLGQARTISTARSPNAGNFTVARTGEQSCPLPLPWPGTP